MLQFIFFALLIITLLAGSFAYFSPSSKPVNPVKFMMESTGFDAIMASNRKKSEQISMTTTNGIMQIHKRMETLATEQNKFLDEIQDQQQILKDANKGVDDILLAAQKEGDKDSRDILRLKALSSEMQEQQRLLVARGQELISLNNQLSKSREAIAEQVDWANMDTQNALDALQQRSASLENQASGFFSQVAQQNQQVQDQIDKMRDKLNGMIDNTSVSAQLQKCKVHMYRILNKEHNDMAKLLEYQERNRTLWEDGQRKSRDSIELSKDSQQHAKDLIDEEHQKQEDQESMIQQRIEDQKQRMLDQQSRRNR